MTQQNKYKTNEVFSRDKEYIYKRIEVSFYMNARIFFEHLRLLWNIVNSYIKLHLGYLGLYFREKIGN